MQHAAPSLCSLFEAITAPAHQSGGSIDDQPLQAPLKALQDKAARMSADDIAAQLELWLEHESAWGRLTDVAVPLFAMFYHALSGDKAGCLRNVMLLPCTVRARDLRDPCAMRARDGTRDLVVLPVIMSRSI